MESVMGGSFSRLSCCATSFQGYDKGDESSIWPLKPGDRLAPGHIRPIESKEAYGHHHQVLLRTMLVSLACLNSQSGNAKPLEYGLAC